MKNLIAFSFFAVLLIFGCSEDEVETPSSKTSNNNTQDTTDNTGGNSGNGDNGSQITEKSAWLIPQEQILDGGPGKDGIPSLDNPNFSTIGGSHLEFLDDADLVLGLVHNNSAVAYPHPILDWHEIINTEIDEIKIAITYCPLTGTGIGWSREVRGNITTFGVSGLLYNSNLIPYDRATDSYWSQQLSVGVFGENYRYESRIIPLVETTWATWKKMYPETIIVNSSTGHIRDYTLYPYPNYKENDRLIFPVSILDKTLHIKERVHGIVFSEVAGFDGKVSKVYRFKDFKSLKIIKDSFHSINLIIVGSESDNIFVSFFTQKLNDEELDLSIIENKLPIIMKDQFGNEYDIFGKIVMGPNMGQQLRNTQSFMGYWFSFAAFFPSPAIYSP